MRLGTLSTSAALAGAICAVMMFGPVGSANAAPAAMTKKPVSVEHRQEAVEVGHRGRRHYRGHRHHRRHGRRHRGGVGIHLYLAPRPAPYYATPRYYAPSYSAPRYAPHRGSARACGYWQAQCSVNWSSRSDVLGCLRYHGC